MVAKGTPHPVRWLNAPCALLTMLYHRSPDLLLEWVFLHTDHISYFFVSTNELQGGQKITGYWLLVTGGRREQRNGSSHSQG